MLTRSFRSQSPRVLLAALALALPALSLPLGCSGSPELFVDLDGADGNDQDQANQGGTGNDGSINVDVDGGGAPTACEDTPEGCPDDEVPKPDPACGDGRINVQGEQCDDKNGVSGDGCTGNCTLEDDFTCPAPGKPCVSTVLCGDGKVSGTETCDDDNDDDNDGCDASCQVEGGWKCPVVGLRCQADQCGDGVVAGFEECDFDSSENGCTDCKIVDGYDCDAAGCWEPACYDGQVDRGEQCEDPDAAQSSLSTDVPFDGCYECKKNPICTGGTCLSTCGDGQRYADEECDDGNVRSGDGCSTTCKEEFGYACTDLVGTPASEVKLPIILRDFIGYGNSNRDTATCYDPVLETPTVDKTRPCYHINFNAIAADGILDVVADQLGAAGVPVLACAGSDCSQNAGVLNGSDGRAGYDIKNFTTQADFATWYDSSYAEAKSVYTQLTLPLFEGKYTYDATASFYPLDDEGWVLAGEENPADATCLHNVSFTTETRFWFEYQGGERFDFSGDDDQWVFVNGQLVIDLGGLHGSKSAHFVLDAGGNGQAVVDSDLLNTAGTPRKPGSLPDVGTARGPQTLDLGLVVGGIYEVAMFQAERNECGSNFKVTLKDFNRPKSQCVSTCGDGDVASNELCDDGPSGNDGSYGKCGSDCQSRGLFCGDGLPPDTDNSSKEACDDGVNLTTYGAGCAPGCKVPPSCGDSKVQSTFEDCDDGTNAGAYGGCAQGCVLGPRCGDKKLQKSEGEQCDDGNRVNGDGCSVSCGVEGGVK